MSTIKLKLKRIDPVKYGVITGLLMALVSLIFIIPMFLIFSAIGATGLATDEFAGGAAIFGSGIAMLFIPIVYGIFGFIFGVISTLLLNFILKKTNGLEVDFEKVGVDVVEL